MFMYTYSLYLNRYSTTPASLAKIACHDLLWCVAFPPLLRAAEAPKKLGSHRKTIGKPWKIMENP